MEKMDGPKIVANFCVDTFYEFIPFWLLGTPRVLEGVSVFKLSLELTLVKLDTLLFPRNEIWDEALLFVLI